MTAVWSYMTIIGLSMSLVMIQKIAISAPELSIMLYVMTIHILERNIS